MTERHAPNLRASTAFVVVLVIATCVRSLYAQNPPALNDAMNDRFDALAADYVDQFTRFSPVGATTIGDHRFDHEIDQFSPAARAEELAFIKRNLDLLAAIDRDALSRANQVDHAMLLHDLRRQQWEIETLQEWAWNPIRYTQIAGGAIYGLVARDFKPIARRLERVADRLEQFPRMYEQIRLTLEPARVPAIHAETATKQNRGVISILDNMVRPRIDELTGDHRDRLNQAMNTAVAAVEQHQVWLEQKLVPHAGGDFRLGPRLYDEKLALTLGTSLTRQQLRDRAEQELQRVRAEMYSIAAKLYRVDQPDAPLPVNPDPERQQTVIKAILETISADAPAPDAIVSTAEATLKTTTDFVRKHNLVTIPPDPLDIILMPEFQRGVSVAYCDSPGALEVGQKTFYAVAPCPDDWTDEQCRSFLREYNTRSLHNLTIHEAMPGHFLQLAHANRYDGRLRSVLSSGVFVEGWACYTEQMMSEQGYMDRDPLMRLVTLKWYLRSIANTLLDQAVHVDGVRREDAMHLMTHDTFQEQSEAAGKWIRAQVTSAQLSTYFVGYQEHRDMRLAAERAWGAEFSLQRYHDAAISYGSPSTRFVRALLLDEPIPQ